MKKIFGPVPSRRLGFSLGVDLVPFKTCTLDCVYCQLGSTGKTVLRREEYVPIDEVLAELGEKLEEGGRIDWITLSGSGEPTLNSGIGRLIPEIKKLSPIPVAVLTNGTLLNLPEVREALTNADLVVPSLDAGTEETFQKVNRPHPGITLDGLTAGIASFTEGFSARVWLEVMLLPGISDSKSELEAIAGRIKVICPEKVQLNTAVRPGAEAGVEPLSSEELERARLLLSAEVSPVPVEVVAGFVGKRSEAADRDLLAAVGDYLKRRPATVEDLAAVFGIHRHQVIKHLGHLRDAGKIREVFSGGKKFFAASVTAD
jgi:wyosine [tRNA(Phe)-imidazoG37] synthetase (radical SAM superfamily)